MGCGLERGSWGWHGDKSLAQSMLHLRTNPPSILSSLFPFPLSWQRSLKSIGCLLGLLFIPPSRRTCTCLRACALLFPQLPCPQNPGPSTSFRSFFSHPLSEDLHASLSKMAATIPTPFLSALTTIQYIFDLLITLLDSLLLLKFKFPEVRISSP